MGNFGFKRKIKPFEILTDEQVEDIHLGTLEVLKETGIRVEHDKALKVFKENGCEIDNNKKNNNPSKNRNPPSFLLLIRCFRKPQFISFF